ncbi:MULTISPECIES: hypothetical protein [Bradyrhizobium]|nr:MULTISPECIES: hypothetical protein [Bradyrhizobium]
MMTNSIAPVRSDFSGRFAAPKTHPGGERKLRTLKHALVRDYRRMTM